MKTLFLFTFYLLFSLGISAQTVEPYKNPDLPISDRVEDLLSRMTLEEKIGQMDQLNITLINTTGEQRDVELVKSKAREYILNHHIGSFLNGEAVPAQQWYEFTKALQKIAVEESRLGIPIIYGIDHMHGASYLAGATIFPHNINLAATFDVQHSINNGHITALESADLGHHWIFAPVLDLGRNPKWPRLYETYGESYHVASEMGSAYVKALQNNPDISPYKVAATGKHFLGYSDPRSGWDRTPVDLSGQSIHELHAPAFQAAIDAGMKTIMVNSSEINGIPVHASKEILTNLLRGHMGFDGVIVTDWDDIGKLVNYHYTAKDYTQATEMALNAGIDMSMTPTSLAFSESVMELVKSERISESRIDESVRRILTLKFELGLFEHPYPRNDRFERIGSNANKAKARAAAEESIVLLKNENAVLPLVKSPEKILLVGRSANSKRNLSGGWTVGWQGAEEERYPKDMHTIYTALKAEFDQSTITLMPENTSTKDLQSAAREHDLIIAAIGEEPYTEFVGNLTTLELPADQQSLITTVAASGKPVIGIFVGGRPLIVSDVLDEMDGYLWAGLPGFEGAESIANILSGDVNPSGKLPFSYPIYPSHFVPYNHKPSDVYFFDPEEANSITQGEKNVWQWPFGFGLSYTEFEYSDFTLSANTLSVDETITASITVTNTGERAGKESVIWYLHDQVGTVTRPVKEVKHMKKIFLEPGESSIVQFTIEPDKDLGFPDENRRYRLEPGKYTVMVNNEKVDFELLQNQTP
ncbi:glycoside hydrolase family 3 N-terminal domain-containing protein [Gracilimonas mengyeensis]|uniref:beta-glucosidase n=1 Tax=Gracilimonas mengyeensis TaxID=1302730 RepID=A0A521EXJ6_9BACT|nr:glycoside hydrolase family 3 N-terminal domain-containing protein [Gracilimonas mengyeensis]SMO88702.1 beta-glucosidase [Gracilimonas mengyeensis]